MVNNQEWNRILEQYLLKNSWKRVLLTTVISWIDRWALSFLGHAENHIKNFRKNMEYSSSSIITYYSTANGIHSWLSLFSNSNDSAPAFYVSFLPNLEKLYWLLSLSPSSVLNRRKQTREDLFPLTWNPNLTSHFFSVHMCMFISLWRKNDRQCLEKLRF